MAKITLSGILHIRWNPTHATYQNGGHLLHAGTLHACALTTAEVTCCVAAARVLLYSPCTDCSTTVSCGPTLTCRFVRSCVRETLRSSMLCSTAARDTERSGLNSSSMCEPGLVVLTLEGTVS